MLDLPLPVGCQANPTRAAQQCQLPLADEIGIPGSQGNNPGDRQGARLLRRSAQAAAPAKALDRVRLVARQFEFPWLQNHPNLAPWPAPRYTTERAPPPSC